VAGHRVVVTPAAERQLAKLRRPAREMVAAVLVTLGTNPRPAGCIKLTASDDLWRIRVRQYRVIYQILDAELLVTIVKVGDRKGVYR
jgi:mRNA interferase RelE/StbE